MRKQRDITLPPHKLELPHARHTSHAVGYRTGMEKRAVAESILQHAHDAGLYAHDSPDLIAVLLDVDLDRRIPRELYDTIAGLLIWLHNVDKISHT